MRLQNKLSTLSKIKDFILEIQNFKLKKYTTPHTTIQHTDLQNPLLKKYKFDAREFVQGAKEAFIQVHSALASVAFFNYVNG
jgi:hypothetical protein